MPRDLAPPATDADMFAQWDHRDRDPIEHMPDPINHERASMWQRLWDWLTGDTEAPSPGTDSSPPVQLHVPPGEGATYAADELHDCPGCMAPPGKHDPMCLRGGSDGVRIDYSAAAGGPKLRELHGDDPHPTIRDDARVCGLCGVTNGHRPECALAVLNAPHLLEPDDGGTRQPGVSITPVSTACPHCGAPDGEPHGVICPTLLGPMEKRQPITAEPQEVYYQIQLQPVVVISKCPACLKGRSTHAEPALVEAHAKRPFQTTCSCGQALQCVDASNKLIVQPPKGILS